MFEQKIWTVDALHFFVPFLSNILGRNLIKFLIFEGKCKLFDVSSNFL